MGALGAKPLDDDRLAAIRRRLARITEPPWESCQPVGSWEGYSVPRRARVDRVADATSPTIWPVIAFGIPEAFDAEFIRCAPDDVRALLNEVERLRGQGQQTTRGKDSGTLRFARAIAARSFV